MTHTMKIKFDDDGDLIYFKVDGRKEDRIQTSRLLDLYSIIQDLEVKEKDKEVA